MTLKVLACADMEILSNSDLWYFVLELHEPAINSKPQRQDESVVGTLQIQKLIAEGLAELNFRDRDHKYIECLVVYYNIASLSVFMEVAEAVKSIGTLKR